jgi:hypothetical protein
MSLWNKVLIGLLLLLVLPGYLYVSARTLRTHEYWRNLATDFDKKIAEVNEETREIKEGLKDGKLRDGSLCNKLAKLELDRAAINRGRVWAQCEHQAADPKNGQVAISPATGPAGITPQMLLYLFEESEPKDQPDGQKEKETARYLGEFVVTEVADKAVLQPTMALTAKEMKQLVESSSNKGTWIAYEMIPIDRHDVFADMSDDDKQACLPEATLEEYKKDGQPARPAETERKVSDEGGAKVEYARGVPVGCPPGQWNKVDENEPVKYVRPLRDYRLTFRTVHEERTILADISEAVKRDLAYLKGSEEMGIRGALEDVQQQLGLAEKEVADLNKEGAAMAEAKQRAVEHQTTVLGQLKNCQTNVARAIRENLAAALEIARIQTDAARQASARTQVRTVANPKGAN